MCRLNQSIKKLSYSYDLVSGNVNEVIYQKGETDEFRHKYNYDADNRITNVFTSKDGVIYEQDAKYFYYDHGPLARTEIGHSKVQAMDYAYTIQGWIKSVNGEEIDEETMMGWDGAQAANSQVASTINKHVAKDAFGFTLNYFEGDYRAIGTNKFEAHYSNTPFGNASANLYNGNIRHMVTAIEGMEIQGYAYVYDQLQRLNTMKVFRSEYLIEDNDWKGAKLTDDYFTRINYDKNGNILTLQRNGYKGAQLEMDRFEYFYETIGGNPSNRLSGVKDSAPNYAGYDDIKDGSGYKYNRLGELVYDDTEEMKLEWRYGDHKLKNIERLDQNSPNVEFIYNPLGVRVAKIIKPRSGGVVLEGEKWKVTYYSYDANGQLMATYNSDLYNGTIKETKLEEQYIYGSKRVGVIKANKVLYDEGPVQASTSPIKDNFLGKKRYELTNHLGNVLATITDRKVYNSIDGYYEPVMTMKADYYAFGMLMPNRFEGIDESRHLFNGMEHDGEVSGEGNSYTTEFRQYDPRLGRWKSLDPLMASFPWQSPYVAFDNNPIFYTDPLGLAAEGGGDEGEPVKKGSGKEIPLQGTFEEVQIIANKNPKTQQIKENVLMSKGKYADSKYDGYRTSLEAYLKSRSLIGENPNYSANDHINNYDRYGWSKYDLNNVVLTPEQHRELDAIWGDNYDLFIEKIKFGTAALVFIAAAPALPSAALAKGYIATSVGKGIVNATINWTVQYSLREDAGNIDYASVIISGGSGFLPGSTTRQIITSGLLVGAADGNIDYTSNNQWKSTFEKSTSERINESLWGAINIGGNNAFKTAPTWAKAWSSTVIETGTQGISYGINNQINKK